MNFEKEPTIEATPNKPSKKESVRRNWLKKEEIKNEKDSYEQQDTKNDLLFKKAERLLDKMSIPNKKTVKKWLAGALAGTVAMTAVETQNANSNTKEINTTKDFTPIAQKAIEKSRMIIGSEKGANIRSMSAYLDIPSEKINEGAIYTTNSESLNGDTVMEHSYNKEMPLSGDDIYFISKNALALVSEEKENNVDGQNPNLFDGFRSDIRTFTFKGVEIEPVGQAMSFEATGVTKSDAILAALEEGVEFVNGTHITGKEEAKKIFKDTTENDGKGEVLNHAADYEDKYMDATTGLTAGFIDYYEVESIKKEGDNGYKVKLKIVFGEQPKYQLPDGMQLADKNSQPYYEINTKDKNKE